MLNGISQKHLLLYSQLERQIGFQLPNPTSPSSFVKLFQQSDSQITLSFSVSLSSTTKGTTRLSGASPLEQEYRFPSSIFCSLPRCLSLCPSRRSLHCPECSTMTLMLQREWQISCLTVEEAQSNTILLPIITDLLFPLIVANAQILLLPDFATS